MSGKHDDINAAGEAHSDLNTFAIIVSILEGGHVYAPSYAAASRIIRICQAEQQKRLRDYDRFVARAAKPQPSSPSDRKSEE